MRLKKGMKLALFGKSKEEKSSSTQNKEIDFQNIIVDTEDINKELKSLSSVKNIPMMNGWR